MATFYSNNTRRKDEPEDLRQLRQAHGGSLSTLKELFADWSEEDLLYAIQDAGGDLESTILRISDGHATQWGEVKGKKKTPKPKTTSEKQDFRSSNSQRGGFVGRGRGDSFRGGRGGATRGGPRALNGGDRNGRPAKTETDANNTTTTSEPSLNADTVEAEKGDQTDAIAAASADSWNVTPTRDTTPATTNETTPATNGRNDTPTVAATTSTTTAADASWSASPSAAAAVSAIPAPRKVNTATIPAGSKMSWAKIVKPSKSRVEKKTLVGSQIVISGKYLYAISDLSRLGLPEVAAAVIEEEKAPEPVTPEPEVVEPVVEEKEVEEKEVEEKVEEVVAPTPEPEVVAAPEPVQAAPVSPKAATPVGPPGLKAKVAPQPRRLNQDAPVVMPNGSSALQSVAVKFGSFSLNDESDSAEPEATLAEPIQPAQAAQSEAVQPVATPAQTAPPTQPQAQQQQQPAYGRQPNIPSGASGYQAAAASPAVAVSGLSPAATNASYIKQDPAVNYLGQHHHHPGMGHDAMGSPYGSYMPGVNQLGSFGMGPMASLPNDYAALYGNDLQRAMYYDPASTTGASTTSTTQAQQTLQQQQQQQAYPNMAGMPYYPYYYMPNQFPNAYQQSGYGQPFVNKNMYPMYQHQQQQQQQPQHGSNKPGAAASSSPYGNYSSNQYSQGGYEDMSGAGIHGMGGLNNDPYGKYNPGMQNFLGNQQQPATPTSNATNNAKGNSGTNNNYSGSDKNATAGSQSSNNSGSGASSLQGQQPGGNNSNNNSNNMHQGGQQGYYQQQMFSNYQYPSHHQGYHPSQHQGSGRNQQQQFWSQN
ncbi:RNAPII degradation factor [Linnemannia schmuckeri]|uniref:RNA polymerase II degradation factor 1 n=1 Tax=Linnemannia schmuckeri TaxID=64567 RepID=A0A9P5VB65_9FUNG|nr:RNAPII degradation factor [Linnemannia schmuckeri]